MADGQLIAAMAPTGRKLAGPALDVVELAGPNGLKHQALVFHEQWRGHPLLTNTLQPRLTFMEHPEVSGIARLAAHDLSGGAFAYATGTVWTLAEIVRIYADNGTAPGVKAGLELCYLVGEMLSEAADASSSHGMIGHGNINPWTLSLKGDGQPVVVAYGLPQVELLSWKENNRIQIGEDSFRYAPPERIETGEDEFSSDLFSLALVALELMVGRPVYDGVLADVKQQASRGEGMRRLYQWREKLPQNVREVMGRALKPDPDTRFSSALELVYAVHDLLGSIDVEGPSLLEVMAKVRASEKRGRALKGGQTQLLTPEEMAELAADLQEVDQTPLPPPRRPRPDEVEAPGAEKPRWSKPVRRADPAAPAAAPAPLRASGDRSVRPPPQAAPPQPVSSPVDRPRRRLASESSGAYPAIPAGDTDRSGEKERLRRRLRGTNLSPEDLAAPDDVQLEPVVEKRPPENKRPEEQLAAPKRFDGVAPTLQTGRAPPPTLMAFLPPEGESKPAQSPPPQAPPPQAPPPQVPPARPRAEATTPVARPEPEPPVAPSLTRSDNTPPDGTNGKSAAAALLERLRTSGDRRRRLRSTADDPGLPSQVSQSPPSLRQSPSLASASPSAVPPGSVTAPQRAPTSAAPTGPAPSIASPAAPPPPVGLSTRTIAPVANTPPVTSRTVDVRLISRTLPIPLRERERVASLTVRAATDLGAWRVDPSGRMFGGFRLERAGVALPSDSLVPTPEPGSPPLDLVAVRPETRMIEVRVQPRGAEPVRLRTPLELTIPCRWVVNGLVAWLGLPEGDWAARLSGERFDGDRPAGEALSNDILEIYEF